MAFERGAATAVATILLMSGVAWAGFDTGVLITKSPQFEQAVSHVLVGRLNAFHEIKAAPGRYVAEIAVSIVEKGAGVRSGDRIYVRFTSPKSLAQIRTERLVSDCGDRKIDPLPGEWMRIYTRLNEDFEYVADHPSSFLLDRPQGPRRSFEERHRPHRPPCGPYYHVRTRHRLRRGLLRPGERKGFDLPTSAGSSLNQFLLCEEFGSDNAEDCI